MLAEIPCRCQWNQVEHRNESRASWDGFGWFFVWFFINVMGKFHGLSWFIMVNIMESWAN